MKKRRDPPKLLAAAWILITSLQLSFLCFAASDPPLDSDGRHLMQFLSSVAPANHSGSPCQWAGVSCAGEPTHQRIVAFDLTSAQLRGEIPASTLGRLDALVYLNLFNNSLNGSIPADLWQLPKLSYLNLSANALTDTLAIPSNLSSSSLQTLDLSNNRLHGFIPAELYQCHRLQTIDLSSNNLGGFIPAAIEQISKIRTLILANNSLIGEIPGSVFRFPFLAALDLSSNQFTGSVSQPDSLRKLRTLDVSNNQLTGSLPPRLFTLPFLESVSVRKNNLNGQLPPPLNTSKLTAFDADSNGLKGTVPQEWWTLPSLAVLRLSNNFFSGTLSPVLAATISELNLQNNSFQGDMASILTNWPRGLTFLDLSSNNLTGKFPHSLRKFPLLQHLGIADNLLSISSFPSISQLLKLQFLNLSKTHLFGVIPADIGALRNLMQLDLSHNSLHGNIPLSIATLTHLLHLDLSVNKLTGSIPTGLGSLASLQYFNVSYNNLSGKIPSSAALNSKGASAFTGNVHLCGAPLHQNCPSKFPHRSKFHKHRSSISLRAKISIIVGAVAGCFLVACCILTIVTCWKRVERIKTPPYKQERYVSSSGPFSSEIDPTLWAAGIKDPSSIPVVMFEKPLMSFTFADLLQATSNFSKENQIADGAYGAVFAGSLPGGLHIAVKILVEGAPSTEEMLLPKLEAIAKLKHSNLVPLLGYCLIGIEKILVYEAMPNGDLHHCLHDLPEGVQNTEDWSTDTWENPDGEDARDSLSWRIRHKITLGTARALAFLHHGCSPPIVHQDLTASNILLDAEYEAHLADTGLADLLTAKNENPPIQSLSGYVPPEYIHTKEPSPKGDVFSFGVLLLEIVTGKRPTGDYLEEGNFSGNLVNWVRTLLKEKRGMRALDPRLSGRGFDVDILEALKVGYLCTAEAPAKRPTMQQVVGLLKDLHPTRNT